jgi:two-component system, OmpR family, response regulator NblR
MMSVTAIAPIPHILFIKTEEDFTQKAARDLKDAGYSPIILPDIQKAIADWESYQPSMIILERGRAGDVGLKFIRRLRSRGQRIWIVFLVDRETLEERIACLDAGADDYVLKPYRAESFLKLVRFYLQPSETSKEQLQFGDLVLDLSSRRLLLLGKAIDLTMKEFDLLKYLMAHPTETLSRDQIIENVWGDDFQGESNVIEVYIRYLRLKIEHEGHRRLIHTVRGVGYVLREP